jgi:hypothetical protein
MDRAKTPPDARAGQMVLQYVHVVSVSRCIWSVWRIDSLSWELKDAAMAHSTPLILVLSATGKTGSRVANNLTTRGLAVRTAARSGAGVRFDSFFDFARRTATSWAMDESR